MLYTIQNSKICVTVDSLGAQVVSVKKDGREKIWQNPTGEWNGHSPVLFPVCGHFGVYHEGVDYPISAHGFVRRKEFVLTGQVCDELAFTVHSDEETRKVFPFEFSFTVRYKIQEETLIVSYEVENVSKEKPMYFACGSHEAYALDKDVDGYELRFEKEEKFLHCMHDCQGYLTEETKDFGEGKVFPLPIDFLQKGATLIFKEVQSRRVWLCEKDGKELVEVGFDGFGNLLLWRADEGKFICVEPWTNLPDYAGVAPIEFSKKDGVMEVGAGQTKCVTHTVKFL